MYKIKLLTKSGVLEVIYMFITGNRHETESDVKNRMDSFIECMSLFGNFIQLDCQDISPDDFINFAKKSKEAIVANPFDENEQYGNKLKCSGFIEPKEWVYGYDKELVYIAEELIFIL